ncbi:FMN-binding protein [Alloscardovia theropitheci]|uniref:FMN-binding protein n=1 Tax=Alloscardovia theropitheci TaxID=2496842 RepID=A0A4R0QS21_9BIFI|nr:FMN-binding protein [Alloscardovia theropitheci]TCD54178.1 FMN-binding protein [Alloscardovia theropitheci]
MAQEFTAKEVTQKTVVVAALGVLATSVALAGCGSNAPAAGDNADTQSQSTNTKTDSDQQDNLRNEMSFPQAQTDTGNYADGTYTTEGSYGEHGASKLSLSVDVQQGKIAAISVKPTTSNAISKKYAGAFVKSIDGQVVGKDLKDLKVDIVAGASWTTEAFNTALTNVRGEASQAVASESAQ